MSRGGAARWRGRARRAARVAAASTCLATWSCGRVGYGPAGDAAADRTADDGPVDPEAADGPGPEVDDGCASATEVCNGRDDDCDGLTDEPEDLVACPSFAEKHVTTTACVAGRCQVLACEAGFHDCDEIIGTGCETVLGTSEHCTACGDSCLPGGRCEGDRCAFDGVYAGELLSTGAAVTGSAHKVTVDGAGAIVVAGAFILTADFGGGERAGPGGFVAKFTGEGEYLWDYVFPATQLLVGGLATDAAGNVYLGGMFRYTADFGDGPHTDDDTYQAWLLSLDGAGALRWTTVLGTATSFDEVRDLSVAPSGVVAVTLSHDEPLDFGGGVRTGTDAVVVYDGAGGYVWDRALVGTAMTVAVGGDDRVAVGFHFDDPTDFGGGVRVPHGWHDVGLIVFGAAGEYLWDRHLGGSYVDYVHDVVVSPTGAVAAGGSFAGTADFGGGSKASGGWTDAFFASYGSDGAFAWDRAFGGDDGDSVRALAIDVHGRVVAGGFYTDGADLGDGPIAVTSGDDAFVMSMNPDGSTRWYRTLPGTTGAGPRVSGVHLTETGLVLISGFFLGPTDLGGGLRTPTSGANHAFVLVLRD